MLILPVVVESEVPVGRTIWISQTGPRSILRPAKGFYLSEDLRRSIQAGVSRARRAPGIDHVARSECFGMATDPATVHELIGRRIVGGDIIVQDDAAVAIGKVLTVHDLAPAVERSRGGGARRVSYDASAAMGMDLPCMCAISLSVTSLRVPVQVHQPRCARPQPPGSGSGSRVDASRSPGCLPTSWPST